VCDRYRLTHSKQYLAERFGAPDEIEDRPRYNIAPTQQVVTVRKEDGKKTRKFTTMRWGPDSVLGKRHEHRNPDAQCSVGERHNETGISRSDPEEALPYSIGWILRVAEDGISEAALLF